MQPDCDLGPQRGAIYVGECDKTDLYTKMALKSWVTIAKTLVDSIFVGNAKF